MAERRMFAKTIVLSDAFLDLPMSARCLYFTLGMLADDDGFVNAPRAVMRQCGASDDDMKVLLGKKFVLLFESGVIVIKHWRINNYLRSDRYSETKYVDEKAALQVEDNGSYRLGEQDGIPDDNQRYTNGIPVGIPMNGIPSIGKDSIGKVSIGKVSIGKDRSVEGGLRGEQSPAPCPDEKTDGPTETNDPEKRRKRIDFFVGRLQFFEQQGWNGECWFNLAAAEGISRGEIDLRKIQLEKQKEEKNK